MQSIAIIGVSGQFGCLLAEMFLRQGKVVIGISRSEPSSPALSSNPHFSFVAADAVKRLSPDVVQALQGVDVVLISVPIASTETVIRKVAPLLRNGQIITDVTSVKVFPVKAMALHAPKEVEVVGMHPMFSPTLSIRGKHVIFTPDRIGKAKLDHLQGIFRAEGAEVLTMSAREHDQMVAVMQALTHFIFLAFGKTLVELKWDTEEHHGHQTTFYTMTKALLERVLSFDPTLYAGIQLYNQEAPKVLEAFLKQCYNLYKPIEKGSEKRLTSAIERIRDVVPPDPSVVEKTNTFYHLLSEEQ